MNNKPLVSILVMTYNHEFCIANTIESCLNQTYKNIEICIGNDNSTDDTDQIITSYVEQYPTKIKYINHDYNMGKYSLAINYNSILALCNGKYIAMLDGDEYMENNRLEKQLNFLESNNSYIAVTNKKHIVNTNHETLNHHKSNYLKANSIITGKELILYGNVLSSSWMAKNVKELKSNISLKVMGDWYILFKLSNLGNMGIINEYLTKKIIHSENVTSTQTETIKEDMLITLALIEKNYPKYTKYINLKRCQFYLGNIKSGNFQYLNGIFSFSIFTIMSSIYYKVKEKLIKE